MAEVKWIKIAADIFDDEKVLLIESMPDADSIIVIWFKLLCMAGKQNNSGVFLMNDKIAYTDEMLSTIFRRPINTVRLALQTFEQFGMIEIINNVISIPNWGKHQQLDAIEKSREQTRKRVQAYRNRQRLLMESHVCQYCGGEATGYDHIIAIASGGTDDESNKVPCCTDCSRIKNDKPLVEFLNNNRDRINDEIVAANEKLSRLVTLRNDTGRYEVTDSNADRIDKNRIDKNINNNRACARAREGTNNNDEMPNAFGDDEPEHPDLSTLEAYASNNIVNMYNGYNMDMLKDYMDRMPEELIRCGIDLANKYCKTGKPTFAYVDKILKGFEARGFTTAAQAFAAEEERQRQKSGKQKGDDDEREHERERTRERLRQAVQDYDAWTQTPPDADSAINDAKRYLASGGTVDEIKERVHEQIRQMHERRAAEVEIWGE